MNRPAAITAAGLAPRPFHYWTGRSGRPYVHSVFAPKALPRFRNAALLLVRHRRGRREALHLGWTGETPELVLCSGAFAEALAGGANEVHVHLPGDAADGAAVIADLAPCVAAPAPLTPPPTPRPAARDRAGV